MQHQNRDCCLLGSQLEDSGYVFVVGGLVGPRGTWRGVDAAMAFAVWTLDCGSWVGRLVRDRGLPLARFGGTEEGRLAGTQTDAACDGGGEGGNRNRSAFLERKCWQAV